MRKIGNKKLENYMLEKIDQDNMVEQDKVYRYLYMSKLMREAEKSIKELGVVLPIENGTQRFFKENPALKVWSNMDTSMRLLLDSIEFKGTKKEIKKAKEEIESTAKHTNIVEIRKRLLNGN